MHCKSSKWASGVGLRYIDVNCGGGAVEQNRVQFLGAKEGATRDYQGWDWLGTDMRRFDRGRKVSRSERREAPTSSHKIPKNPPLQGVIGVTHADSLIEGDVGVLLQGTTGGAEESRAREGRLRLCYLWQPS